MADYKERLIEAKKILDERLKREKLTKEDATESAKNFYEYMKESFIDKALEHFIYRMERFDESLIVYSRKTDWHETDNKDYNEMFESKLSSLIKDELKLLSPDFCEYSVDIEMRPVSHFPSVKEKYLTIVMKINE